MNDQDPSHTHSKTCPTFSDADYDFSSVPANELEACLYYEYMRESRAIIEQVATLRKQLSSMAKHQGTKTPNIEGCGFSVTKVTSLPVVVEFTLVLQVARLSRFPEIPWQSLSSEERKTLQGFPELARRSNRRLWLTGYPPLAVETAADNPALGDSTLNSWSAKLTCNLIESPLTKAQFPGELFITGGPLKEFFVSGFFQLNLNYSRTQLESAFREWLKANHPRSEATTRVRRGRKTLRDQLNALAAMRLRYHYGTFVEARKIMKPLKEKPKGMFYEHRESFRRACDAAASHFRDLLPLGDNIAPVHLQNKEQSLKELRRQDLIEGCSRNAIVISATEQKRP